MVNASKQNSASKNNGAQQNRRMGGGNQPVGRYRCPWINTQIIAEAESGDLPRLINAIQVYLPHMNLVNISTAMHRLARLVSISRGALKGMKHNAALSGLCEAAHSALKRATGTYAAPPCQALSNVAWSLATLRIVDPGLWETTAELARHNLASFKPFELSSVLWAFAKAGQVDERVHLHAGALFQDAAVHLQQRGDDLTFRCLVMTVWAFASFGFFDRAFFYDAGNRLLGSMQSASCQELSDTAWAFGTAGVLHEGLFQEIARASTRKLGEYSPRQLSDLLHAYYAVGFHHPGLAEAAASMTQGKKKKQSRTGSAISPTSPSFQACDSSMSSSESENGVKSFYPPANSTLAPAVRECRQPVEAVSPTDSVETLQEKVGVEWVCSVKNTFLHIEGVSSAASTCSGSDHGLQVPKQLPQPLDFLAVDDEFRTQLDAYRYDYQRFRLGAAWAPRGAALHYAF